eukprot:TRINITY_DN1208_c0_g1_i3.p1 TRINITY_DN1208_c0_g1~~TRINITY_DN1208_c0_g1_i3.p1  ORF type:complete len:500 (-),score=150.10 TRINITY_DN1208_c0_g1_i3:109-1608(-)
MASSSSSSFVSLDFLRSSLQILKQNEWQAWADNFCEKDLPLLRATAELKYTEDVEDVPFTSTASEPTFATTATQPPPPQNPVEKHSESDGSMKEVPPPSTRGFLFQTAALRVEDDEEIVMQRKEEEQRKGAEDQRVEEDKKKEEGIEEQVTVERRNEKEEESSSEATVQSQQEEEKQEEVYNNENYQKYIEEVRDAIQADEEEGYMLLEGLLTELEMIATQKSSSSAKEKNSLVDINNEIESMLEFLEDTVNTVTVAKPPPTPPPLPTPSMLKKVRPTPQTQTRAQQTYYCSHCKTNRMFVSDFETIQHQGLCIELNAEPVVTPFRITLEVSFNINKRLQNTFRDFKTTALKDWNGLDVRVEKVLNPVLLARFMRRWNYFKTIYPFDERKNTPIIVYHGTASCNKDGIVSKGFLIGGKGVHKANGSAYGSGIYCSELGTVAQGYSQGLTFVCAALLGRSNRGGSCRWPVYYDSNYISSASYIVLYNPSQILPLYAIMPK